MENDQPVLLFDGVCNLCNASVQWVIRHDPQGKIRFASLQSGAGQQLLAQHGLPTTDFDSVVMIENGKALTRSDVPLRILELLGGRWRWAAPLRWVPKPLRDAVYKVVAKNRYRWFGRRVSCMLPTKELKARFL